MSEFSTSPLFERVERVRRRKPRVKDEFITLAHGGGGRASRELIEGLFLDYLRNPLLEALEDQAVFELPDSGRAARLAFTGTVNDLAMSGARPLYLSAGFILEEGLPVADLKRILESMRATAREAGVEVVTGDTKVVGRGGADKLFINTSGLGVIEHNAQI